MRDNQSERLLKIEQSINAFAKVFTIIASSFIPISSLVVGVGASECNKLLLREGVVAMVCLVLVCYILLTHTKPLRHYMMLWTGVGVIVGYLTILWFVMHMTSSASPYVLLIKGDPGWIVALYRNVRIGYVIILLFVLVMVLIQYSSKIMEVPKFIPAAILSLCLMIYAIYQIVNGGIKLH